MEKIKHVFQTISRIVTYHCLFILSLHVSFFGLLEVCKEALDRANNYLYGEGIVTVLRTAHLIYISALQTMYISALQTMYQYLPDLLGKKIKTKNNNNK